jgi:type VI protein secretion system component VasF
LTDGAGRSSIQSAMSQPSHIYASTLSRRGWRRRRRRPIWPLALAALVALAVLALLAAALLGGLE